MRLIWLAPAFATSGFAQVVRAAAIEQQQQAISTRIEALTILGGDYSAAGGIYTFRGGTLADLDMVKFGGGGDVAAPSTLGVGGMKWAPVLEGNIGDLSLENQFQTGYLQGNRMHYDTLAIQGGAGARFYFDEHLSLAPTLSGIYGRTENQFQPGNPLGEAIKRVFGGVLVDYDVDTWSVLKKSASSELFTAIRNALQGKVYITPLITKGTPLPVFFGRKVNHFSRKLTPRQREVLQLIAEGCPMKQAGYILKVTPRTVAFHKYTIMEELGLKTSAELVQYAVQMGLVP